MLEDNAPQEDVSTSAQRSRGGDELWGHPRGLAVLCCTECWERFSYYGNNALLAVYLRDVVFARGTWRSVWGVSLVTFLYGQPDDGASDAVRTAGVERSVAQLYGLYNALVYLTPLAGGLLADLRYGQRRLVLVGALLMSLGHGVMVSERATLVGLALIALGNGAFKPNVSTQVGRLYDGDASPTRRNAGFSIFYVAINLGSAAAPLVCASLAASYGAAAGFAAAGVGMLVALCVMLIFWRFLPPDAPHLGGGGGGSLKRADSGPCEDAGAIELAPRDASSDNAPPCLDSAELSHTHAAPARTHQRGRSLRALLSRHRLRVLTIVSLACLNIAFWASYSQTGDALAFFIDSRVSRGNVPAGYFQALNPILILALTPGLNALWRWQAAAGQEPHAVTKMALGCALLSLSYIVLALACAGSTTSNGATTSAGWIVLQQLILTLGELYVSPVGLSFVTQAAPPDLLSFLMGVWFLSSFFGNYLGGALSGLYASLSPPAFFAVCAVVAGANAVAVAAAAPRLRAALLARAPSNAC